MARTRTPHELSCRWVPKRSRTPLSRPPVLHEPAVPDAGVPNTRPQVHVGGRSKVGTNPASPVSPGRQ